LEYRGVETMSDVIMKSAKAIVRGLGIDSRKAYQSLSRWSIDEAVREHKLVDLVNRLRGIVPNLRDQFTGAFDEEEYERYWEMKMRAMHAWQARCALRSLDAISGNDLTIVDIGDSSGTHVNYVKSLAPAGKVARVLSVNLDSAAVERIRSKGGEALQARAEDWHTHGVKADLSMSFEMMEHLTDPVRFLHSLAESNATEYMLVTVPYRRTSRFGGMHMRLNGAALPQSMNAEEVHIYEFSPEDWQQLFFFAGFRPVFTDIYRQYARYSASRVLAPMWRRLDFEGFLAIFARRDMSLADRYADW
jgi:2-polyprenyl-3-methyl-5-hydroxy-6-metoxy-1,4-benzoquinol methylase